MIYNNGYIRFLYSQNVSYGEDGAPLRREECFGDTIECMYSTITDNKGGRASDANFIRRMYRIHIPNIEIGNPIRCELFMPNGSSLLNGSVQSISYGRLIDRIEITIGE